MTFRVEKDRRPQQIRFLCLRRLSGSSPRTFWSVIIARASFRAWFEKLSQLGFFLWWNVLGARDGLRDVLLSSSLLMRLVLRNVDCRATPQHCFLRGHRRLSLVILSVKWVLLWTAVVMLRWVRRLYVIIAKVMEVSCSMLLLFVIWFSVRLSFSLLELTGLLGSACTYLWQFFLIELLGFNIPIKSSAYWPIRISTLQTVSQCYPMFTANRLYAFC